MSAEFDFIIIGSGPAGALLASRLAAVPSSPSVLVLEAGGPAPGLDDRSLTQRWIAWVTQPQHNWGYNSVPQKHLDGRAIDASRGKALGGTQNINFSIWTTPNKADIAEWQARVGGDPHFSWTKTRELMDGIEKYIPEALKSNPAQPLANSASIPFTDFVDDVGGKVPGHGEDGRVSAEFAADIRVGDAKIIKSLVDYGIPLNKDLNSGNSLGIGFTPAMSEKASYRVTAATAWLANPPDNLHIKSGMEVSKILFDGKRAVGVEVNGGEVTFKARKAVISSAGTLNTPKLLMLSGIGPQEQLAANNIPVIADLPAVGANLRDHWMLSFEWKMTDAFGGPSVLPSITPSPNQDLLNLAVAFVREEPVLSLPSFASIPPDEQRLLKRPEAPTVEFAVGANWPPEMPRDAPNFVFKSFAMPSQARGAVRLASADWRDAPLVDPNYLGDEGGFDLACALAHSRLVLDIVAKSPAISDHIVEPTDAPRSASDEDIAEWVRANLSTGWHYASTARMGRGDGGADDVEGSAVDTSFRVHGFENLYVVDMSVAPLMPSCHVSSFAYLIGAWAAERIIEEYLK